MKKFICVFPEWVLNKTTELRYCKWCGIKEMFHSISKNEVQPC